MVLLSRFFWPLLGCRLSPQHGRRTDLDNNTRPTALALPPPPPPPRHQHRFSFPSREPLAGLLGERSVRDAAASPSCPANDYGACASNLPGDFCCNAKGSFCLVTSGREGHGNTASTVANTTIVCCPFGNDCSLIVPIPCDLQKLNVTAAPKSPILTTELDQPLVSCGNSTCCPPGYSCTDDQCVLEAVEQAQVNVTTTAGGGRTALATATSSGLPPRTDVATTTTTTASGAAKTGVSAGSASPASSSLPGGRGALISAAVLATVLGLLLALIAYLERVRLKHWLKRWWNDVLDFMYSLASSCSSSRSDDGCETRSSSLGNLPAWMNLRRLWGLAVTQYSRSRSRSLGSRDSCGSQASQDDEWESRRPPQSPRRRHVSVSWTFYGARQWRWHMGWRHEPVPSSRSGLLPASRSALPLCTLSSTCSDPLPSSATAAAAAAATPWLRQPKKGKRPDKISFFATVTRDGNRSTRDRGAVGGHRLRVSMSPMSPRHKELPPLPPPHDRSASATPPAPQELPALPPAVATPASFLPRHAVARDLESGGRPSSRPRMPVSTPHEWRTQHPPPTSLSTPETVVLHPRVSSLSRRSRSPPQPVVYRRPYVVPNNDMQMHDSSMADRMPVELPASPVVLNVPASLQVGPSRSNRRPRRPRHSHPPDANGGGGTSRGAMLLLPIPPARSYQSLRSRASRDSLPSLHSLPSLQSLPPMQPPLPVQAAQQGQQGQQGQQEQLRRQRSLVDPPQLLLPWADRAGVVVRPATPLLGSSSELSVATAASTETRRVLPVPAPESALGMTNSDSSGMLSGSVSELAPAGAQTYQPYNPAEVQRMPQLPRWGEGQHRHESW